MIKISNEKAQELNVIKSEPGTDYYEKFMDKSTKKVVCKPYILSFKSSSLPNSYMKLTHFDIKVDAFVDNQ